jgi:hypothetical protein
MCAPSGGGHMVLPYKNCPLSPNRNDILLRSNQSLVGADLLVHPPRRPTLRPGPRPIRINILWIWKVFGSVIYLRTSNN